MSAGDDARRDNIRRLRQQQLDYDEIIAAAKRDIDRARDLEMDALLIREKAETELANAVAKRARIGQVIDQQIDKLA